MSDTWNKRTRAVHAGTRRSQYGEVSEAIFLTQGFVYPSAEAADLFKEGAASFHRQLVKGDLASEYDNEIRLWLEELHELEEIDDETTTGSGPVRP